MYHIFARNILNDTKKLRELSVVIKNHATYKSKSKITGWLKNLVEREVGFVIKYTSVTSIKPTISGSEGKSVPSDGVKLKSIETGNEANNIK